ncbi:hypothetical protein [Pontibacter qinzhouensis]|uniref:hypothetical protein n=1 Tax=Pontibacter qinzhouensis TaxID=2603253 RepID=UPI00164EEADA|nr:hypothetical protein [Pontibacter qinzhouensis]
MKVNRISKSQALTGMVSLITAVILFHGLIITGVLPYEIVWAGKLNSVQEMYVFEAVSLFINVVLLITLLVKGNYLKFPISDKIVNAVLWFFIVVFSLNTVGNLLAETLFEKAIFTPLTFVSAILLWIIVRKKKKRPLLKHVFMYFNGGRYGCSITFRSRHYFRHKQPPAPLVFHLVVSSGKLVSSVTLS